MPDDTQDETSFRIDDISPTLDLPQRRFNAALAVGMDDKLYIYGGTYEIPGRGEMTLDDFHVIDLGKLDGVRTLYNKTILPQVDELVSSSSDDSDPSDYDSDDDAPQKDQEMENLPPQLHIHSRKSQTKMDLNIQTLYSPTTTAATSTTIADEESPETAVEVEVARTSFNPAFPQPLPFETLKAYYDRTAKEWLLFVSERSKAARREAFVKAEGYWWECREEVREIEERMEESGVKEVVVASAERKEKRR
jgi:Domain of unknown function (DUF4110)